MSPRWHRYSLSPFQFRNLPCANPFSHPDVAVGREACVMGTNELTIQCAVTETGSLNRHTPARYHPEVHFAVLHSQDRATCESDKLGVVAVGE